MFFCVVVLQQEEKDPQWKRAMDYLSAVSELNYMTQIVIMLYEDNNKVSFSFFIICGDVQYRLIRNIWKYFVASPHRTSRQRNVSMWSFTSARVSKVWRRRRMLRLALGSGQLLQR